MNGSSFSYPINIPWTLIATSGDMMDADSSPPGRYPFAWRSSLAVYAYEPKVEELDVQLCDQRITFLKVTTSITGLRWTEDDAKLLNDLRDVLTQDFPDEPVEDKFQNLLDAYFACYGVLLNVAVFPRSSDEVPRKSFPIIVDFEPKCRDLYQAATETGEILTASHSQIQSSKSLTSVKSSEMGLNFGLAAEVPAGPVKLTPSAGMTPKWGQTHTDAHSSTTDTSREARETQGTTTNISQMYNLLTGYHPGTNRAVFLMLPRPHTLQPTDRRTFVNGVREIEGVQEFFLIVSRPKSVPAICIQATLETGHFPEDVPVTPAKGVYETDTITFDVDFSVTGTGNPLDARAKKEKHISPDVEFDGWEVDPDRRNSYHGSVTEEQIGYAQENDAHIIEHEYRTDQGKLFVDVVIDTDNGWPLVRPIRSFHHRYTVHRRRKVGEQAASAETSNLVVTRRSLGACFATDKGGCIVVEGPEPEPKPHDRWDLFDDIVPLDQAAKLREATGGRAFVQFMQRRMARASVEPRVEESRITRLIDTDYAHKRLATALPAKFLATRLAELPGFSDAAGADFAQSTTVGDFLRSPANRLRQRLRLPRAAVAELQRQILTRPEPSRGESDRKP